jgi:hypothetical protein
VFCKYPQYLFKNSDFTENGFKGRFLDVPAQCLAFFLNIAAPRPRSNSVAGSGMEGASSV